MPEGQQKPWYSENCKYIANDYENSGDNDDNSDDHTNGHTITDNIEADNDEVDNDYDDNNNSDEMLELVTYNEAG